ncbi:uncharacterized protein LOC129788061 isoform X2 [Lutzomyia longipalpis]|uniref:uncharacterized protein LOC129788061 isoform X2 n=1 Tax=Lutzomyia longipalpis TaxID=7200 RepID=UPI0024843767|nr:uncharacterized protein LOC129788061 isoform X2 [Lutzomyia longipalpis]
MWKKKIPSIIWFLCLCATFTTAIQIDNRLVSAQNDCFERIALGAMMPFDSTFRNTDTNLLRTCEELCAREGTKCQTFAFGIHPRGNGTCQLSSQRIDASKSRPVGTIFDPDFDMYARKENCLPMQGTTSQLPFPGNFPGGTDRPAQFPPSSTSARPGGPPFTSVDSTENTRPPSTPIYTTTDTTGSSLPTTGSTGDTTYSTQTTNRYPETPSYPSTEGYPNRPPNRPQYGGTNYSPTNGRPYGPEFPSQPAGQPGRYPGQRPIDSTPDSNAGQSGYYPAINQRPSHPNAPHKIKPLGPLGPVAPLDERDKYRPRPINVPAAGDRETGYGGNSGQPNRVEGGGSGGYQVTELPSGTGARPTDPYGNPSNMYEKPVKNDKYKPPTGGGAYGPGYGSSGGSGYRPRPETPCFRRVLAGKRVASHWVRRTLSCERVEDCQRECGEEKRFICEGFNYRLDPSGRGQGNCELTEVPLGEMDLYSSPFHRDKNLINHPDYDYYERDRSNSPSCKMPTGCVNCGLKPYRPPPPSYGGGGPPDYFRPTTFRPQIDSYPGYPPDRYKPETSGYGGHFRPPTSDYNRYDVSTAVDIYRPPPNYQNYKPYGVDRYDQFRPSRPERPSFTGPPSGYYDHERQDYGRPPPESFYQPRPDSNYRPRPSLNKPRPSYGGSYDGDGYRERYPPPRPAYNYLDRDDKPTGGSYKPQSNFVPYQIGQSTYGGAYSGSTSGSYWGIQQQYETKRPESNQFNYFELGGNQKYSQPEENSIWGYPGSRYGPDDRPTRPQRVDYGTQWTRRPGADECSVKSSEGFRLHKGVVRLAYAVPNVRECEKMCVGEEKFKCYTYSYRYSGGARDNCFLCDRPYNLLDYYADLEPDRDCDIYSMSDDMNSCTKQPAREEQNNAQCFFKAIDSNRFFKSIVRDSLTVKSIGECEWECIKSTKFTCRSFTFRYRAHGHDSVIDNCQLSDWPCKDIDKDRHLVADPTFDIYERASYGHGCELQPIVDEKHQKLCYLGYGSPAKLLSSAIKKVISAPTELDCKNECIRFRETTPFKCYSFSYGSQASSYNCEMSDLDQSELKVNVHYTHTTDRDFWLFAWNPFDFTCRDKVTSVSGNRNDRRMDVFREPGEDPWRHFTVSGKPCRNGAKCEQNIVTGFYSCEIDGGEIGSWDYCCKEDHPCGYSQGFDYPWCYVGDKLDQWRTCSDRYFPGKPSSQLSTHPTKKKGEIYQQPPRPGGLQSLEEFSAARLWPITFLYNEGPPNSTELSNVVDCKKEDC